MLPEGPPGRCQIRRIRRRAADSILVALMHSTVASESRQNSYRLVQEDTSHAGCFIK